MELEYKMAASRGQHGMVVDSHHQQLQSTLLVKDTDLDLPSTHISHENLSAAQTVLLQENSDSTTPFPIQCTLSTALEIYGKTILTSRTKGLPTAVRGQLVLLPVQLQSVKESEQCVQRRL